MSYTRFLLFFTLLFIAIDGIYAQSNCTLLGNLPYPQGLSNIWGYAADGREYAIVGTQTGTAVVDVTDPTNPDEVGFIEGGNTIWREIKTFGHYAYVVQEQVNEGLVAIDLSQLPDTITATTWYGSGNINFSTAHTLYIDENGIVYIFGANYGVGGAIIADLSLNPIEPTILGVFDERYIHDGYVRNDTLWAAEINDGQVDVVNVTDKSNPVVMASFHTPDNFSHNCWLSDDGNTLYTTDEVFGAYVAAYDVSDLSDIKELDRVQSNPGSYSPPHNTYVINQHFLPTSYYTDGVVIFDATYPDNLIEVGNYDTSPLVGGDFNGAWGVYPYLPSQNLLVSDMQEGLFIIRPTYVQAAYLRGNVTDNLSGSPIAAVSVNIVGSTQSSSSNFSGQYATGIVQGATYSVQFSKPGYETLTINDVVLTNGIETTLNAQMVALPSFTLTGSVTDASGAPIGGASILFNDNNGLFYEANSNADGTYSIPSFVGGIYDIIAGKWGYITQQNAMQSIDAGALIPTIVLQTGYYDDFALNFGWTSSGTTQLGGEWGLGDPVGTSFSGFPFVFQPEDDLPNDIGADCYATGNTPDFLDMVDGGTVTLTSPIFDLTNYAEPILSFALWIMNVSQTGAGNDEVFVRLSNGTESVNVLEVQGENLNPFGGVTWQNHSFNLNGLLPLTATMQLSVEASADFNQFELLEVAFDGFSVIDSLASVNVALPQPLQPNLQLINNPSHEIAHFVLNNYGELLTNDCQIMIYDLMGKVVQSHKIYNAITDVYVGNMPSGLYVYALIDNKGNQLAKGKMTIK